jgi:hypothetical protein
MTTDNINAFLCDDLLYGLLVECAGAPYWPVLARVCVRWRGIIAVAPPAKNETFIETTAAACATTGAVSVRLLFGWATRARALATRIGPLLLHVGHLISATVNGEHGTMKWIRAQQLLYAPKGCPPRRPEAQWIEGDDDYAFCPRCGPGREADLWSWACAARSGHVGGILADVDALLGERPWPIAQDARRRWCALIGAVLPEIVRRADVDSILRFFGRREFIDPLLAPLWKVAAQVGRLDVIMKTRKTHPRTRQRGTVPLWTRRDVPALYESAARGGFVHIMDAISEMCPEAEVTEAAYWRALEMGHVGVLDWLAARQDDAVREWDRCHQVSPRLARAAPTAASLKWLRHRDVAVPPDLLAACTMHFAGDLFDPFALPGSADVVAYAVDVCGCHPPSHRTLVGAAQSGRIDLLSEAHRRGWINDPRVFREVWTTSVECGADDVVDWLADRAPDANTRPPFKGLIWLQFESSFDALVLSHIAGHDWCRVRFSRLPKAAHIVWASAHEWTIDDIRLDRLVSVCGTALALLPRDSHTHAFDVPQAKPLAAMTRSQAAVVCARILVRTLARSIPRLGVDASQRDQFISLCEGLYRLEDEADDVFGLLEERAPPHDSDGGYRPTPHGCARRHRTRERRKRSLALRRREGAL